MTFKFSIRSKPLSRRTLLQGAGVSLSLPLLEAMIPSGKTAFAQENNPTRMIAFYFPNGMHMASWRPSGSGTNFTLNETMAPLEKAGLKNDIQVLGNVANRPASPEGFGDHAAGTGGFLTAVQVKKTRGSDIRNSQSVDQAIVQGLLAQGKLDTPLPSLELGIEGGGSVGNCDSGYSCAYTRNISWVDENTPRPKITDPRFAFDRLFSSADFSLSKEERNKREAFNKSVLDYVQGAANKLNAKLGARDQNKMEEYFSSIRDLETKLDNKVDIDQCGVPDRPAYVQDRTLKSSIMNDLMVLAFRCDITRVATHMLGNAGSQAQFDFLNIFEGHHTISHHQMSADNYEKLKLINHWEVEQLADLLSKLKSTDDLDGNNLLDSSMVFFSGEISDGDRHNHEDMPAILAGRANGNFNPGQYRLFDQEESFANIYLSMMSAMGVEKVSFGANGTKTLSL